MVLSVTAKDSKIHRAMKIYADLPNRILPEAIINIVLHFGATTKSS